MKKDNILVIGQGFLGKQIAEYFATRANVTAIDYPQVDITHESSLRIAILKYHPTIVINAAAFADTHAAEKQENHAKAFDINVKGVTNLLMLAREFKFQLVHIGTGMIYDGVESEFSETDTPNPTSYYSWTKAAADAILMPFCNIDNILIVRIHMPISSVNNPKNLLSKIVTFNSFTTDRISSTVVKDFLICLEQLLIKRIFGVVHVANRGAINVFDIATLLQKHGLISSRQKLKKTTIDQLNEIIVANGGARQTKTVLNIDKLTKVGIVMPDVKKSIEQCIVEYKENYKNIYEN